MRRLWIVRPAHPLRLLVWCDGGPTKKGVPPSLLMVASPYDPRVHYAKKRSTIWIGYKVHLTDACDDSSLHLITHVETTLAPIVDRDALEQIDQSW
jgi:hypothetical protein